MSRGRLAPYDEASRRSGAAHSAIPDSRPAPSKQAVRAWAALLAWIGLIGWLSSDRFSDEVTASWLMATPGVAALGLPPAAVDAANLILRKSAHFVEYAVLTMLAYRAFGATASRLHRHRQLLGALLLALVCAGLDEWHQATTVTRTGSARDVALDGAGALAGALAGGLYLYRRSARASA